MFRIKGENQKNQRMITRSLVVVSLAMHKSETIEKALKYVAETYGIDLESAMACFSLGLFNAIGKIVQLEDTGKEVIGSLDVKSLSKLTDMWYYFNKQIHQLTCLLLNYGFDEKEIFELIYTNLMEGEKDDVLEKEG